VTGFRPLPAERRRIGARRGEAGASLLDVLLAGTVAALLAAVSMPVLAGQRDSLHAVGAARHLAALVQATRTEALKRGVHVALVFQASGLDLRFAAFADGNYDGVRSADVAAGIDRQVSAWVRISDQFPSAAFGIAPGVTDPESGSALTGGPLKLGGSSVLSFGPAGSSTSGTVYLRGPALQQYAVRLLGATGRCRLLRFDFRERAWFAA
jgi:hypothetical protein